MTLRVAVFVHEFPALSETFVLNQITGLLDLGCDVRIFASGRRDESIEHTDIERYGLMRRVHYPGMPRSRLQRVIRAVPIVLQGLKRHPRRIFGALNPFLYRRAAVSLELLYWTDTLARHGQKFDVIFCHFGLIGRTVSFLRALGAIEGVLVTAFHGVDVSAVLAQRPGLYRHLFRHGDLFLPISHRWREALILHGCDPNRAEVHHMGVELPRFPFLPNRGADDHAFRVLTIGRLVEKKGIEYGLRAVARARERGARIRYTIVGDGPLRGTLEALSDELGLGGWVTFAGWQDQETVIALMQGHQALLAPSVTDRVGDQEGIPVTLMEAMAVGLPVISTRHSGIPELVEDEKSGLLAEEGDVDGLVDALMRLYEDPALRETLGRKARGAVSRSFDVRALNERLVGIFEGLIRTRPEDVPDDRVVVRRGSNGATPGSAAPHDSRA